MSMVATQPKLYGLVVHKLVIDVIVVMAAAQSCLGGLKFALAGKG